MMFPNRISSKWTVRYLGLIGFTVGVASAFALNYDVQYTATSPTIDGTVDAAWASASAPATGFVDTATALTPSTQQTNVRMLWDTDKLYILYEATDDAIVPAATGNDTGFNFATPQDAAEIFFDPALAQNTSLNNYIYHIVVDPAATAYTYTEAGQSSPAWNLGAGSQVAFAATGTNWTVELAVPWTNFNSILTNSPGVVVRAPGKGSVWGAQFGRDHSPGNNVNTTKWHPTAGSFRNRPFGTITFLGGPDPTGLSMGSFTPIYSTSFENPPYTAGQTVSGIEGWNAAYPSFFNATTAKAKTGTQCMEIVTSSTGQTISATTYTLSATKRIIWLQYAVDLTPEITGTGSSYRHVLYLRGQYTTGTDTLGSIWFVCRPPTTTAGSGGNSIQITTYDNPAAENTATNVYFPGLQSLGNWGYVTVAINEGSKTYEVWYNGTKLAKPGRADTYGVKTVSVFENFLHPTFYSQNFGTISGFYDDVEIYAEDLPNAASDWQLLE